MEQELFQKFKDLIYKNSGINLNPNNKPLLVNRIRNLVRERELNNYQDYLEIVETDASGEELLELIEAVSTNTTYFWRENAHFEVLADILKGWKNAGKENLKIWCSASSTGEEPYTLAMEVLENFLTSNSQAKILATDVNTKVLRTGVRGVYSDESVSKLPADKRVKFLNKINDEEWQVKEALSKLVLFKKLNLIEFPYPLKGPIDVIFCRNVMIYFDVPTRKKIVQAMEKLLSPGGYLFLSLSESLLGIEHGLINHSTSVFKKPE